MDFSWSFLVFRCYICRNTSGHVKLEHFSYATMHMNAYGASSCLIEKIMSSSALETGAEGKIMCTSWRKCSSAEAKRKAMDSIPKMLQQRNVLTDSIESLA
jgi:hypothetical protein